MIFPPPTSVEKVSRWIIDIGEPGRAAYYGLQITFLCCLLFLACWPFLSGKTTLSTSRLGKKLFSDYVFVLFIFLFLLSSRIPTIIVGIQNTDEAIWLADAKTMLHDPRIWVSIDTGSGGPLVPGFILILKLFGLPLDQGMLKLLSAAMMTFSTMALFLAGTYAIGTSLSRLFILPLVMAIAAMNGGDTIAYNSEHPAILLLCVALYLLAKISTGDETRLYFKVSTLGFVLGLIPFAKLQAGPIGMWVGLCACIIVYKRYSFRYLLALIACALLPAFLILTWVSSYGGLPNFWMSYIVNNLGYAFETGVEAFGLVEKMKLLFHILFVPQELHFFLYFIFGLTSLCLLTLIILLRRISGIQWMKLSLAFFLLCISVYCIVAPERAFTHYMLLSIVPLTVMAGILADTMRYALADYFANLSGITNRLLRVSLPLALAFASLYHYFFTTFGNKHIYESMANERYGGHVMHPHLTAVLRSYYLAGEKMAIWGWAPELWDCTDFLMGTRDGASSFQMNSGALQQEHMNHYLMDLNVNQPALFVETIGANFFQYQDQGRFGYENYPELKKLIEKNYRLESEIDNARVFVRKDYSMPSPSPFIVERYINEHPDIHEFHVGLTDLRRNGTFLQFGGWTVLTEDVEHQQVKIALVGQKDTLVVNGLQTANTGVADFAKKKEYLLCGFLGFVPFSEIPKGKYEVGLVVKSGNNIGFKLLNQSLDAETFQNKDQ